MRGADPIFAALDAANAAETAHFLACEVLDEADTASNRRCNAACDRAAAARQDLILTRPVSLAGLRALACHYVRWGETSAEEGFLHLAQALAGQDLDSDVSLAIVPKNIDVTTAWTTTRIACAYGHQGGTS